VTRFSWRWRRLRRRRLDPRTLTVEQGGQIMAAWLRCPNTPPCPHPALVHDIWDYDDPRSTCCIDGCRCGLTENPIP
jgi:hypothetical protein